MTKVIAVYMTFSIYSYLRISDFLLMRVPRFKFYDGDIEQNKPTNSQMKLKKLSFLAGAIALTLTAIPFAAQADISPSSPVIVAQGKKEGGWKKLNLTDAQKAQMQEIKKSSRAEMERILTPEQLQKLQAAKTSGEKKGGVWKSLNLTDAQKAELKKVRESQKAQFEAILTPEQKAQIQQMKEMRQNRRGNRTQPAS
ncbi:P pilus assembly/Cpx signaling pathway, periplasmic inhibitor/zinc-resistance associated protein [Rivularia sp. UHCC 0363]|uniref:Spy/CpxP family protein refolding chaperone n=1 Tax=Rivularia sp. UHCC 0363 TaxID=3110244 RepID=UPI002B1FE3EC|nr:P pilus assembly/Cpx signaling pathway, periplasmic inhibitor/zinc-resistance associated protein [Rivularia sp. UHCC 0363]MEA5596315.1 P pilus assembly/Cpx signaling pathway, periplasmic inhibitor/zinc-resistance associated protein [Rivularia sp. UHCC 0363]